MLTFWYSLLVTTGVDLQYAFLICSISESVASPFLPFPNDVTLGFLDAIVGKPFLLNAYLKKMTQQTFLVRKVFRDGMISEIYT